MFNNISYFFFSVTNMQQPVLPRHFAQSLATDNDDFVFMSFV